MKDEHEKWKKKWKIKTEKWNLKQINWNKQMKAVGE